MAKKTHTFGGRLRPKQEEPTSWDSLTDLPLKRMAFVYQRLATYHFPRIGLNERGI
jgi:hypothetical protein